MFKSLLVNRAGAGGVSGSSPYNGGTMAAEYKSSYDLLRKCFLDLENSYLTRSLANLFDQINELNAFILKISHWCL